MNYKEIINKLPNTWDELTLKDYIKLSPVINDIDEDVIQDPDLFTIKILSDLDKNIKIISLLSDTPVDAIEKLTMVQLNELVNRIAFINNVPDKPKTTVKYKSFDQLTYDNFITFEKLSMDFTPDNVLTTAIYNLPTMLAVFTKDNLTVEQFLNLSMPEVIAGFFTVNQNIKKYLQHLQASSYKQMMRIQKNQLKNLLMLYWQNHNPFKKSLTKSGIIG